MTDDVTPADRARFVMYRGMNYSGSEIAERTGVSESTVYRHLNEIEDEAKSSDDPEAYFWSVVSADTFDAEFRRLWGGFLSGK